MIWILVKGMRVIRWPSIYRHILGCIVHRWWLDVRILVCCGTNQSIHLHETSQVFPSQMVRVSVHQVLLCITNLNEHK
jgi:hypothetical protein